MLHTVMRSVGFILDGKVFVGWLVNREFCFELVKLDIALTRVPITVAPDQVSGKDMDSLVP